MTVEDRSLLRGVLAIGLACAAIGLSFGAITVAYGLPGWVAVAMSLVVFAGGAQFMAVGLLAAANPFAAVFAGLLLNARHVPFGLALGDTLGPRLRDKLVGSHIMTDESVAFALSRPAGRARRRAYWATGATLFVLWNIGCAVGVLIGGAAGDPDALGLDAAFPAGLIALILPTFKDRDTRWVALTGAGLAVATTPFLPAGLPVLLALGGLLVLLVTRRRGSSPPDGDGAATGASDGDGGGPGAPDGDGPRAPDRDGATPGSSDGDGPRAPDGDDAAPGRPGPATARGAEVAT